MHPGEVVADRFEICRTAGSGGMGVVYQALDRRTDRHVALKVLVERDAEPTDRFAQEVELLATLEHPHIVGYVTHGFTREGAPYLVMPWLDGEDLQQRLRGGALGIDETLTIARCTASALACLHGRGLVHRDLKPSNLFLPGGSVERVKVIDLGIARASIPSRPMTVSGVLVGTPGFMAPEQARGDREVAPTVDVFALGCVLFECLTGKRLFGGSHVMSVLAKILLEEAPRVSELRADVPEPLDELIFRMVSKEPNRRPRDGGQLQEWLEDMRRAPPSSTAAPRVPVGLTGSEQRVVTVLVVVLPRSVSNASTTADATRIDVDPFRSASARYGVRVQALADGTAIVLAPDGLSGADQAAVLARFGRYVAETFVGATLALATGSAVTGGRLPVGEAIERGVRIVRAAPARGVHIDDVSAALITSRFDIRREGDQLVVEDERLSLDPTRRLLGRPTSCVGRDREFAMLQATLASCAEGAGPRVVLVTAAAGAGKSRLRHEFIRRAVGADKPEGEEPPWVLQCRGDPLRSATPYALVAQAVRQAAELREGEAPDVGRRKLEEHVAGWLPKADVARVTEFLGELVGTPFDEEGRVLLAAARQSAAAMADQIRVACEDVLRAWCGKRTVVLVLEDMHWGDPASVKLVDGALRKLAGEPLLVFALARPDVHERFPALWENRDVTQIRLPPLAQRACTKIVREAMGEDATAEEIERIVERSEGNAFYLEELIRAAAAGDNQNAEPRTGPGREALPQTMIAFAQARLERLAPAVRKVLRAASIFGDVFWLEGVAALIGEELSALEPMIAELVENEAIVPSEHPRFGGARELGFRHALLRGAAYATLTEEDRALGHRLAAKWLEVVSEDREVVALHWLEGGESARASSSFAEAGKARWARAHAEAAARCMVRSLLLEDTQGEGHEGVAARIRLLGEALEATRRIEAPEVLSGIERHLGLPADWGTLAAKSGIVHVALVRALEALRKRTADPTAAESLAHAGYAVAALSDFESAKALLTEAMDHAKGNAAALQKVRIASAKVAFWSGEYGKVVEHLSSIDPPDDPRELVEMLLGKATSVVAVNGRGELARGLGLVRQAEDLVAKVGESTVQRVLCCKARFLCFFFAGQHADAVDAAAAAVELAHRGGLRYEECIHLHNVGDLALRLGDYARSREALTRSLELAKDLGGEPLQAVDECLLAYLDGVEGDATAAGRLHGLAARFDAAQNRWYEMHARYWLGELLASRADALARRELQRALELARELKVRSMEDDCSKTIATLHH